MALGTMIRTIRDFATGLQVRMVFALYPDGGCASLHATCDSNGAPIDPATEQGAQAIHAALQKIIVKQAPGGS